MGDSRSRKGVEEHKKESKDKQRHGRAEKEKSAETWGDKPIKLGAPCQTDTCSKREKQTKVVRSTSVQKKAVICEPMQKQLRTKKQNALPVTTKSEHKVYFSRSEAQWSGLSTSNYSAAV